MLEKMVLQWVNYFLASLTGTASPRLSCLPLVGMCGCGQTHVFPRFMPHTEEPIRPHGTCRALTGRISYC